MDWHDNWDDYEDYDDYDDEDEDLDDIEDEDEERDAPETDSAEEACHIQSISSALNLDSVIDGLSEKEAKDLLKELASRIAEAGNIIAIHASSKTDEVNTARFIKELNRIKVSYFSTGYYDDISEDYAEELKGFMSKYVPELIETGHFSAANEIISAVYEKTDEYCEDDYYGYLGSVVGDCCTYWREIARKCNHPYKLEFMESLKELSEEPRDYDYDEDLPKILEEEFTDPECMERRMEWLDEDIAEKEAGITELKPVNSKLGCLITDKIELMGKIGYPRSETEAVIRKYWILPEVRSQYVASLIMEGRRLDAIQVLLESRQLDRGISRAVTDETLKLMDLYYNLDMTEEYKRELLYYLFDMDLPWGSSRLHEFAQKVKPLCSPDEWTEYRERMLQSERFSSIWFELMDDEGLYERLLDALLEKGDIQEINRYEGKLKSLFPEQLKMHYTDYVIRLAPKTSKRDEYAALMPYLKKIASYPGGQGIAEDIAAQWRRTYSRKPAFMDELKKAGF